MCCVGVGVYGECVWVWVWVCVDCVFLSIILTVFISLHTHAVPYDFEDSASVPAVMSYTKNPNGRKTKKSGFFKKVFR